jgi:hypothetical protein
MVSIRDSHAMILPMIVCNPAGLTQVSSETTTGSEQATFQAMSMFLSANSLLILWRRRGA